ncbi:hypothetical protein QTO34_006113 [Cnephaeus nilssonii]|uniref:Uncharacterized protein n=1 Tax=Cnephaeus nilssonii TaxID=3371016 RepID=A0AA40HN65_CNENI|nr:hypothetical protein QTO34_006113 [Eptesicus nilssonii]
MRYRSGPSRPGQPPGAAVSPGQTSGSEAGALPSLDPAPLSQSRVLEREKDYPLNFFPCIGSNGDQRLFKDKEQLRPFEDEKSLTTEADSYPKMTPSATTILCQILRQASNLMPLFVLIGVEAELTWREMARRQRFLERARKQRLALDRAIVGKSEDSPPGG